MMRYLSISIAALSFLLVTNSCSKDDGNNGNNPGTQTNLRLTKEVKTRLLDGKINTIVYLYDENNRLIKEAGDGWYDEFSYNSNGTLSKVIMFDKYNNIVNESVSEWIYNGSKINYVLKTFTNAGTLRSIDTTFYHYNSENKISKINEISYSIWLNNREITFFDVTFTYSNGLLSSTTYKDGKTDYNWDAKGNLITVSWNKSKKSSDALLESSPEKYTITYNYDDKTNYFLSAKYPPEWIQSSPSLRYFHSYEYVCPYFSSNNNIIHETYTYTTNGNTNTENNVYNISDYNTEGLPLNIRDENGTTQLTYEKY